jgi:hypothetical protein
VELKHFEQLNDAAKSLSTRGIEIYEHHYFGVAFGNWTVVAGKRKERVRFDWDGREAFLTISEASFPDSQHATEWNQTKQMGINSTDGGEVWRAVVEFLEVKFAV